MLLLVFVQSCMQLSYVEPIKLRCSNDIVVFIWLQLRRTPVLFYLTDKISKWSIYVNISSCLSKWTFLLVDEIFLPKYMNWSTNFRGLSFNVDNIWCVFYLSSCRDQCFRLPAPSPAARIRLEQIYVIKRW